MSEKITISVSFSEEEIEELKKLTGKDKNHEALKEASRLGLDFIRKASDGTGDANSIDSVIMVGGGCNAASSQDAEAAKKEFDRMCMKQGRCDTCKYSPERFKKEHGGRPCTVTCFSRWMCDDPSDSFKAS